MQVAVWYSGVAREVSKKARGCEDAGLDVCWEGGADVLAGEGWAIWRGGYASIIRWMAACKPEGCSRGRGSGLDATETSDS